MSASLASCRSRALSCIRRGDAGTVLAPSRDTTMMMQHLDTKWLFRTTVLAAGLLAASAVDANARRAKSLAQGAAIGAGVGVLVDGGRGVLAGATAGVLVSAVSRRGR